MQMPFPGMDPYLEHPLLWPGGHVQLMVTLANQIQPLYQRPCVPSLSREDQAWANERWAAYQAARPDLFPPQSQGNGP